MTVYRYKVKNIKQEKEDSVLAVVDMGMLGDSDLVWIPKDAINDQKQIASWWLEKKGW